MSNTNWHWEAHFNIESSVLMKILVVLLLIYWGYAELQKRRKKRENPDVSIAKANARERNQWRYVRRLFRVLQIAFALYLVGSTIKFLFT
ncbi:hypothetical protein EH227_17215 [Rouxiella chamberiensis]|jgi:phosphate/sulfate permease|nr:hypothetical protein EH227_17215 [Rouxiella chamberiensis]